MSDDFHSLFPFFDHHPGLVYLDAAASTPTPRPVIDTVSRTLAAGTSSAGRGSYRLAGVAATGIEKVRSSVAGLLNVPDPNQVAFTSGCTAAMNTLVRGWATHQLRPGDEVLLSPADHAATIGPWHALAERLPIRLVGYRLTASGDPDVADLAGHVTARTRAAVVTHVHNVFGERAGVADIRRVLGPGPVLVLDAAQSVGHVEVDLQALGADAVVFSGHKAFGPPGIGVLAVSSRLQGDIRGTVQGGVSASATGLARVLERGTPNAAAIAGLGAALDVVTDYGIKSIHAELSGLTRDLVERLRAIPGIDLLPGVAFSTACSTGYGIVSFRMDGLDPADVGFVLDDAGICVRTGSHCSHRADPALESVRVSAHAYTTRDELDRLTEVLTRISRRARPHHKAGHSRRRILPA